MSSNEQNPSIYTNVIDLTQRSQRKIRQEKDLKSFSDSGDTLPALNLDDLPEDLREAFAAAGWSMLMPVQEKAMPYLLAERDMIVQSRTGSGKTGAFLLPLFETLDPNILQTQAVILTPTRELARQVHSDFERMKTATETTRSFRTALIYGGVKYEPQLKALTQGAHLVIGTPGRILDHLEKGNLSLKAMTSLILDEADEMLSMGFYPAMRQIKQYLPEKRHSCMFSATIPPRVRSLANEFLNKPDFLSLSTDQISVDEIDHRYYRVEQMEKDRSLIRIIEIENPDSAIIFVNTKKDVEYLTKFLKNYGHHVDEISGDLTQQARERAMERIRKGQISYLVATDVAARGIDISDLSHVFMYDVPQDSEYYIHRSGRTARAGKTGVAIALATFEEERNLLSIARKYELEIRKCAVPEPDEVEKRVDERLTSILESKMREKGNLEKERSQRFVPMVQELVKEEPELLAMLVDEVYMRHLHRPPGALETEQETVTTSSPRNTSKKRRSKSRSGSSGGKRKKQRPDK